MLPISKDGITWLTEISHEVICTSFLSNSCTVVLCQDFQSRYNDICQKLRIVKSPCKILSTNKWFERMLHIQHKNPNNEVLLY